MPNGGTVSISFEAPVDLLSLFFVTKGTGQTVLTAFDAPDTFQVERWPNRHVAFGGYGVHHCLGASLARLELKILFEELLRRMPDVTLATDEPLRRRPNNFITGIEEMPIRFSPGAREG